MSAADYYDAARTADAHTATGQGVPPDLACTHTDEHNNPLDCDALVDRGIFSEDEVEELYAVDVSESDCSDPAAAVEYGSSRTVPKQQVVAELLRRGLGTRARRVASCRNGGFQCRNPRMCSLCRKVPGNRAVRNYADTVHEWDRFSMLVLHMPRAVGHDRASSPSETHYHTTAADAREAVLEAFDRLKRRRLPVSYDWLGKLRARDPAFAREIRDEYVEEGRSVPFTELVPSGVAGVHIKQTPLGFRAHLDVLAEARWMDDNVLDDVWRDCGGGRAPSPLRVRTEDGNGDEVRPVESTGDLNGELLDGDRTEHVETVDKVLRYVTETVEIGSAGARVDYALSVDGANTAKTWGL